MAGSTEGGGVGWEVCTSTIAMCLFRILFFLLQRTFFFALCNSFTILSFIRQIGISIYSFKINSGFHFRIRFHFQSQRALYSINNFSEWNHRCAVAHVEIRQNYHRMAAQRPIDWVALLILRFEDQVRWLIVFIVWFKGTLKNWFYVNLVDIFFSYQFALDIALPVQWMDSICIEIVHNPGRTRSDYTLWHGHGTVQCSASALLL